MIRHHLLRCSLLRYRTPGRAAALAAAALLAPLAAQVVINEIYYDPAPKTAHHEFVEILNAGAEAVDVSGWRLTAGVDATVPAGTVLAPGAFLLFCEDLAAVAALFPPAAGEEVVATYDYSTATASPRPGTTLAGQDNWIQPAGGTALKAANDPTIPGFSGHRGYSATNSADGTRVNNAAFSYRIPPGTTNLRFSLIGRIKNNATAAFGPGHDANRNNQIRPADGLGEEGFRFGFANNTWFIRQAAQGATFQSPNLGFNTSGRVWFAELRVDPTANAGDGSGSLFVRQLSDTSSNPVTDTLNPVPSLQNINLGLSRMDANGGSSDPAHWNGMVTAIANGHLGSLTIAWPAAESSGPAPLLVPFAGSLDNQGETIRLRDASDTVVDEVSYRSEFPWPVGAGSGGLSMQLIHPALDNDLGGSWRSAAPTPGAQNAVFAANAPPQIRQVRHSPQTPLSGAPFTVTAKITDPDGVAAVRLLYQVVSPGDYLPAWLPRDRNTLFNNPTSPLQPNPAFETPANWIEIPMTDDGTGGDTYTATIPAQANRTLLRYRILAADATGESVRVPYADDPSLNFACFVYDGVPDYTAATRSVHPDGPGHVYPASLLTSLPVRTLITRADDLRTCYAYSSLGLGTWQIPKSNTAARSAYNWEGAFVAGGVVYDHILYRLRQSNDRYSGNGKRSMRFRFNDGRHFQDHDEQGRPLPRKLSRVNTAKMSRFGGASEYGIREVVNARLWTLFGVEVPRFHHAHMRMITGPDEAPDGTDGQHLGDFFGLAMFYDDFGGAFLENRGLPKGNIYKWKDGVTNPADLQSYQARDSVADYSDFNTIRNQLRPERDDAWLAAHVDWDQWSRYHAICEAIRHYDFGVTSAHLKNRAWYFQPVPDNPLGRLHHIPHDHDASWYVGYHDGITVGIGIDYAHQAIFGYNGATEKPVFTRAYRNTMRECRDLLWRPETVHDMIDRATAAIAEFSLADRDRWLSAPAAAGYESSMPPIQTVPPYMKNFAFVADTVNGATLTGGRAAYMDQLAADPLIPATPVISYAGAPGFPANALALSATPYPAGAAAPFGAIQWRLAEITDPTAPAYDLDALPYYEITAVWDSGALAHPATTIAIPGDVTRPGHSYRARVRYCDNTGRWSHWSASLAFTATARTVTPLLHYWNFNNTATLLEPSRSYVIGAAITGTGEITSGTGQDFAATNGIDGDAAGAHLRVNNPLGTTLELALPTPGYGGIVVRYETRRSGQGAGIQQISRTTDGETWQHVTNITVPDAAPILVMLNFATDSAVADNPLFALRVAFLEGGGSSAGNNRIDNLTVEGEPLHADGIPHLLPMGDAAWDSPANWSTASRPDGAGALAWVGEPLPNNRTVTVATPVSIGTLGFAQNDSPGRNRIAGNAALTFDAAGPPALLQVTRAGEAGGFVELDGAAYYLASDLRLLVDDPRGSTEFGGLRLRRNWTGPGGLIKQGPGMASLTGEGKSFTGPVLIEQGALALTQPAAPANTSGTTVLAGGQLRLTSGSSEADPIRSYLFGGGAISLAGPGRSGAPAEEGLGVLGALRYDPGTDADHHATLGNPVELAADAGIHVAGSTNQLDLLAPLSGPHTATKTGGGTLALNAASHPAFTGVFDVLNGTLQLAGDLGQGAINLDEGTILTGHGRASAITGFGALDLNATALIAGSATFDVARFTFTRMGDADPATPADSGNAVLCLTCASPFPNGPPQIEIFLSAAELVPGDRLRGGIFLPAAAAMPDPATVCLYLPDPAGPVSRHGQSYHPATTAELACRIVDANLDFGTGPIAARCLEVLVLGQPQSYAQWRNLVFHDPAARADETRSGPAVSIAPDGVANLLRYAMGLDASEPTAPHQPRLVHTPDGLRFRFRINPGLPDLAWAVQVSPDLTDWSQTLHNHQPGDPPPPYEAPWFNLPVPPSWENASPQLFLRLEITGQPCPYPCFPR